MSTNKLKISFGPEPVRLEKIRISDKRYSLRVRRSGEHAFIEALNQTQQDAYDDLCKGYLYSQSGPTIPHMRYNDTPRGSVHEHSQRHLRLINYYIRWRTEMRSHDPLVLFATTHKLDGDSTEQISKWLNPDAKRPNYRRAIRLICKGLDIYSQTRGWVTKI